MKPPAFQFYADDFLAGTAEMTAEEVGAYIRLLCHQWTKGGIPNDESRVARMAGIAHTEPNGVAIGSPSLRYVLAKFVASEDGMLRNARLERVRAEQDDFRKKQAQNGQKGAEKRWGNGKPNGTAIATPLAKRCPDDSPPVSVSGFQSPSNTNTPLPPKGGELPLGDKVDSPKRFTAPTPQAVTDYSASIGYPLNGEAWCDSYAQKGWKVGRNPMKDWKAAVRNWKTNGYTLGNGHAPPVGTPVEPIKPRIPDNLRDDIYT